MTAVWESSASDQDEFHAGNDSVSAFEEASLKSEKIVEGTGEVSASDPL